MPNNIDIVVAATSKLLSPAAPQVLALLGASEPHVERLRVAVELDPVLTIKIIDFANHSYYGRLVPVASLQRALARLGWLPSCELLGRLLVESATRQAAGALAQPMWQHSLRVAVLSRILARDVQMIDPALAFTAGLVHGLGQLGLLALHRDSYAEMWRQAPSGPRLAKAERARFGFDHAKVGAGVLASLSVPDQLPDAVSRMYKANLATRPWDDRSDLPLAALLQLSQALLYGDGERLHTPEWIQQHPLARRFALDTAHSATLGARFDASIDGSLEAEDAACNAA